MKIDAADYASIRTQRGPEAPTSPRSIPHSLKKNAAWSVLAYFVRGAYQWGLLIAVAKMGTPELLGQIALGLTICTPAFMFSDLQLRVVQATDAKDDFHFGHYMGLRLLTTPLAIVVVVIISLASGYRWETFLVIAAVALAKAPESISDCMHGAMQKRERLDMVATSTMTRNIGSLAVFICVFHMSRSIALAALSQMLISVSVLLAYDLPGVKNRIAPRLSRLAPRFDRPLLFKLAKMAFPLGLVSMIISFSGNLPRYLLERSWGEVSLGIYAAILQPTLVGQVIMSGVGQSTIPRLSRYYATADFGRLTRLVLGLMAVAIIMGGVMLVFAAVWGREFLRFFYKPEYAEQSDVLTWLMGATALGLVSTALGTGLGATRVYQRYLAFYSTSAVLGAALAIYLIPAFGLKGAAWTVCGTNLASASFLGWLFITIVRKEESLDRY